MNASLKQTKFHLIIYITLLNIAKKLAFIIEVLFVPLPRAIVLCPNVDFLDFI